MCTPICTTLLRDPCFEPLTLYKYTIFYFHLRIMNVHARSVKAQKKPWIVFQLFKAQCFKSLLRITLNIFRAAPTGLTYIKQESPSY